MPCEDFISLYETMPLPMVALHLTVERGTCNKNGGPAILLLGMLPGKAQRGESAWTPRRYSAPIRPVLPEAKPVRHYWSPCAEGAAVYLPCVSQNLQRHYR